MSDCIDCKQAALIWHWAGLRSDCQGCEIRAIAKSPYHVRKAYYERASRLGKLADTKAAVKAESARIKALKDSRLGVSIEHATE